jgi:tetratricopeptide (TPR) repeat protein
MVWLCLTLGRVVARQGRSVEAEDWLKQGQAISHKISYLPGIFNGLLYSAEATIYQGEFIQALSLLEETLTLRSDLDFGSISEGWVEEYQSMACLHLGHYQEAHRLARAAITKYEHRDNIKGVAFGHWLLANSHFIHSENQEALSLLRQSAQTCQETGEKRTLNLVKLSQSYVLHKIGHKTQAQQLLAEALDFGLNHRSFIHVLTAIPAKAMFLGEEGETQRAVELYALATSHAFVGNSRWFADAVGQYIKVIAATLPPEVIMAAQARGRNLDLWQTAESLLTELAELGWGEDAD